MDNIIEEYDKWWQIELDTYHQREFWDKIRVDEERGTNIRDISIIISKAKEVLRKYEGTPILKGKEIVTKWIDFTSDKIFLKDLRFIISPNCSYSTFKVNGTYCFSNAKYDKDTDALYDNTIKLRSQDNECFLIDSGKLDTILWHELQHAYRHYCIKKEAYLKSNNNDGCYVDKNDCYNISYGMSSELPKYFGEIGLKMKQMIYMSDKNEIDSHMQEMIPYIEKNTEINFSNYKQYLKDNPSYDFLMIFKEALEDCDYYATNTNAINNMGIMLKYVYSNLPRYERLNWTIEHYFKVFHNRMKSMYIYAKTQFYKILYYTLEKYGRRNIREIAMHTDYHWDLADYSRQRERLNNEMVSQRIVDNKITL